MATRRASRSGGDPARPPVPLTSLREQVLDYMGRTGKPVAVRELSRRLDLDAPGRRELKSVLRSLMVEGDIVDLKGSRVGLPSRMNLVVGRLSCSASGYGFVVPESREGQKKRDVYVSAHNMKEALHGDRVVARVERRGPRGPEGRIIRILERSLQRLVGRFEAEGRAGGRVVPFDRRVLHELFVPSGEEGQAESGQMVLAEITRPPTATRNPLGRVLEVLGRLEERGVDLKVVMAKYGLPDRFPEEVDAEAARVPREVREAEVATRTDFRTWDTVTVDPETARDHDDAISLDQLPNGHWRLGVHIADVGHYVGPGSLLDQEAYLRGTSVYFPDRVVPMLPHALSSHICSLVEGQDRLTQTVVLELDARGRVRKTEFHDGVIRSRARLTYQEAQGMVDGDPALAARFRELLPLVRRMDELAKLMRQRRYERGSLDFDLPEPKLILDAEGEMTGIVAAERLDSMRVIEEFMLAANEAVAARLSKAGMPALFRIHEPPDPERVEEFAELAGSFGYRLPAGVDGIRPQDFQLVLRQAAGKPEEKLVSYLLLRTMKLARYHEENLGHFGLATEMYAHFTSPIRRYPDLVVHRALRALRRHGGPEAVVELPADLPEMGRHLSDMERKAAEAERELVEWKKVRFMADKVGEVFAGYVTGVQAFGLFVELDEIYVQGLVHISSMADDYYRFEEKSHRLVGENMGQSYRLGDRVEVQLARVDLERRQVDFVLAGSLPRAAPRRRHAAPERHLPRGRPAPRPRSGAKPPRGERDHSQRSRARVRGNRGRRRRVQ
jgi:ribonuclease R